MNVCQNETAGFVRMKTGRCDKDLKTLERVKGIEPSYSAWKAAALPLSYTRIGAFPNMVRAGSQPLRDRLVSGLNRINCPQWTPESAVTPTSKPQRSTEGWVIGFRNRPPYPGGRERPILVLSSTTKGGDPVSFTKRCHLAGIAR